MKKINVIDLDKTLIPYDSFGVLIKREIKKGNLSIFFSVLVRVLRLRSNAKFKEIITKKITSKPVVFFSEFAEEILKAIDPKVQQLIDKETDDNTINILVSASPDVYVQPLIKKMNWQGSGSFFDANLNFNHLYGKGKIKWLKENFNPDSYIYNFAISDSSSDDELLSLFKKKKKWILL